jgi:hypothetical protein
MRRCAAYPGTRVSTAEAEDEAARAIAALSRAAGLGYREILFASSAVRFSAETDAAITRRMRIIYLIDAS